MNLAMKLCMSVAIVAIVLIATKLLIISEMLNLIIYLQINSTNGLLKTKTY